MWDEDRSIWQIAALMIDDSGELAPELAADMAEVCLGRGDKEHANTWLRVSKAALVLLEARERR